MELPTYQFNYQYIQDHYPRTDTFYRKCKNATMQLLKYFGSGKFYTDAFKCTKDGRIVILDNYKPKYGYYYEPTLDISTHPFQADVVYKLDRPLSCYDHDNLDNIDHIRGVYIYDDGCDLSTLPPGVSLYHYNDRIDSNTIKWPESVRKIIITDINGSLDLTKVQIGQLKIRSTSPTITYNDVKEIIIYPNENRDNYPTLIGPRTKITYLNDEIPWDQYPNKTEIDKV